jgi:hypothetical protein
VKAVGRGKALMEGVMEDDRARARSNIRLALFLGVIALGFFVLGLYLAAGGEF